MSDARPSLDVYWVMWYPDPFLSILFNPLSVPAHKTLPCTSIVLQISLVNPCRRVITATCLSFLYPMIPASSFEAIHKVPSADSSMAQILFLKKGVFSPRYTKGCPFADR